MKILIVDDDPAILNLTKKLLELQSYEVDCCENALDAIQKLGELTFDILVTDATMPAHSGFDLIRTVKKRKDLNYLTIAMLTGRSEKSDIEQAVELGVQDYIVKPIDPEVFLEKVEKLVERHKKKKDQKPTFEKVMAELLLPVKLVRITDIGITIECPFSLEKGMELQINVAELRNEGLRHNTFKVIFSNEAAKDKGFVVELIMLKISGKEQKILTKLSRKWLDRRAS